MTEKAGKNYTRGIYIGSWLWIFQIESEPSFRLGFDLCLYNGFSLSFAIPFFYVSLWGEPDEEEE